MDLVLPPGVPPPIAVMRAQAGDERKYERRRAAARAYRVRRSILEQARREDREVRRTKRAARRINGQGQHDSGHLSVKAPEQDSKSSCQSAGGPPTPAQRAAARRAKAARRAQVREIRRLGRLRRRAARAVRAAMRGSLRVRRKATRLRLGAGDSGDEDDEQDGGLGGGLGAEEDNGSILASSGDEDEDAGVGAQLADGLAGDIDAAGGGGGGTGTGGGGGAPFAGEWGDGEEEWTGEQPLGLGGVVAMPRGEMEEGKEDE